MPPDTTLTSIDMTSGVNERGEGFVTIAAHGGAGVILLGQLSPAEVRAHALAMLGSAEAAEQDAAVLRVCRKLELPDQMAGLVITELHEEPRPMSDDNNRGVYEEVHGLPKERFRPEDAATLLARLATLTEELRALGLNVTVDVSFKITAREP